MRRGGRAEDQGLTRSPHSPRLRGAHPAVPWLERALCGPPTGSALRGGCPESSLWAPCQGPCGGRSRALPVSEQPGPRFQVLCVYGGAFITPTADAALFLFFGKGANISSFNVAQLSRLPDLKCFSLTHFNLVNMLQQVANFSGMALLRHLHIKRVGGPAPSPGARVTGSWASTSTGTPGFGLRLAGLVRHLGPGVGRAPPLSSPVRGTRLCPPALLSRGGGAPWVPHGREGPGLIFPQVRSLNRVWRYMDVNTEEDIAALSRAIFWL